ncbi:MAG: tetratricopeptide repeat protein [Acidobacteria bacterium]|nr:tetratricopeptide repeat protein [Acidobacteriota bacterium]
MNRPGGDTKQRRRRARALLLRTLCLLGIVTAGCGGDGPVPANPDASSDAAAEGVLLPPGGRDLVPVAMPDFELMTEPVAEQMRTYRTAVRVRLGTVAAEPAALGDAYGQLGMLLLAATYVDAAEASLLNAQTLQPDDGRWPYYLGRVHEANGDLEASAASYRRAVDLRPDDLATRMLLANVLFARGELEAAERIYSRALERHPDAPAAQAGLGRVALARREYAGAAARFEQALAAAPWATAVHYPLALAYRGLGDMERAEAHLQRQGDVEALSPDPLRQELDELLESANAYNIRGGRALDAGNYRAAADLFRRGLELDPDDPSLRQRLGVALFQLDDVAGAVDAFEQVVRTTPEHTEAQFSLGVVRADQGRHREAIDHLSTALRHDSAYIQARMQLANVLARSGRADEALSHYERALAQDPTRLEAMFGAAMTLVRLERYAAARDRLQQGVEADPGNRMFRHALARLLASAPDGGVRDGRGAMTIVEELLADGQDLALGETAAMALAEMGLYDQAAAVQRDVMAATRQAGLTDALQRMAGNLALYEAGRPSRTPFTAAELP